MVIDDSRPGKAVKGHNQGRVKEAVQESETGYRLLFEGYRLLFENMLEGFASCRMIFDRADRPVDFLYLNVNRKFAELTGLGDVVGKRASEVIPGIRESNPELLEAYGRVAMTGKPERFETFVPPLGIWFSISVYSTKQEEFVAVFDNITARKNAETAQTTTIDLLSICNKADSLRELIRDLTLYFQQQSGCEAVGVRLREGDDFPYYETRGFSAEFVLAENSLCTKAPNNELLRDHAGHPVLDCMCGNILCGRFDPDKPYFSPRGSFWSSCTTDLLATTSDEDRQAKTRNRCNGEGYESVALIPLRSHGETMGLFQFNDRRRGLFTAEKVALLENLVDYVAIALAKLKADAALRDDIGKRTRSEEALLEATQRLQLATASRRLGIWDYDIRNDELIWDELMYELYGMAQDGSRMGVDAWRRCLHPDDRDRATEAVNAAVCGDKEYDIEFRACHPDGSLRHIKANGIVIWDQDGTATRMIGLNQDITDQKHLEEQLRQSQKMEAIGQLAGGVAHDFNNILTAIYGYCSLLQLQMGKESPYRPDVDHIFAAAERAANLTKGLLAFSRKQVMTPKPLNLNDVIVNIEKLLARIIGEDICLKTSLSTRALRLFADSGQIEQVMMNLAANARDAMPHGGLLTMETGVQEIDQDFIHAHGYGAVGTYAVVSVSDTGTGMDAETSKKIFEPFFTTKEMGRGTGLGLSIAYGVIKQHNGYINVYSEPGKGTTFRIYFPLIAPGHGIGESETPPDYPRSGTETVLVAEDDASIRMIAESVLTKFGYQVILAQNGHDAIEKFSANRDRIHIIVMDMIMPGKSGKDAYEEIRRVCPDVRVLFMSGYSHDLLQNKGLSDDGTDILLKPLHPLDLVRKVRSVLDA